MQNGQVQNECYRDSSHQDEERSNEDFQTWLLSLALRDRWNSDEVQEAMGSHVLKQSMSHIPLGKCFLFLTKALGLALSD